MNPVNRTTGIRPSLLLRLALLSITTIVGFTKQQHLAAQEVANQAPPAESSSSLPDLPFAVPLQSNEKTDLLALEADSQSRHGDIYRLEGNVVITFRGHTVAADRLTYDATTGEVSSDGPILITGGRNDEYLKAARGTYNLNDQTGRFYEVSGSVGLHAGAHPTGYVTTNPFLFSGRMVIKTGPEEYDIYDGRVTSCALPNPDWQLVAGHFALDSSKAKAYNSTFRVLNIPIIFLPYVTHPINSQQRQSGLLIPSGDVHSSTKGTVIGDEVYLVLGRSADLTAGLQYFSKRGFAQSATFRYKGIGNDFATAHFTALQDRGYFDVNNLYIQQGGQDFTIAFRKKLTSKTRVVGDAEYLSSYVYREAFNENFNQAVSSDITSIIYAVNQQYGFSTSARFDRYQGLKRVPIGAQPGQQVRIFHAPSIDFSALDHHIGRTPLVWNFNGSIAGLKRTQPNFISSGIVERLDLRPELALPLSGAGWNTMSSISFRHTFYSRSRRLPYTIVPVELTDPIDRNALEMKVDIRPPVIERTFTTPRALARLFGPELRHTVEPELIYDNVRGINTFNGVLRFDDIDIASNTNELEYGVTQHLFARRRSATKPRACATGPDAALPNAPTAVAAGNQGETPSSIDANGIAIPDAAPEPLRTHARGVTPCEPAEPQQQEWISWRIAQKHFFDTHFGNAVINTRRNIFDSTLSFSGIAFLTEPREVSPLISRLRVRTSSHTDLEWDFDLDTGAKRFTSSNIFLDAHEGQLFGGISYARLNAPGRFYTETIDNNAPNSPTLSTSAVSDFSQMRLLAGWGNSSKRGLSLAGNANLDLRLGSTQYISAQTTYNWNCCGLSVEYRKYELGSVRNEGTYKFNFTLANIGTAGNIRKSDRLF